MIRLILRALIALCAAMAVYVSILSWRGARAKAKYNPEELAELAEAIKKPQLNESDTTPAIGEWPETELLANTSGFKLALRSWLRENPTGTLAWALSLESNERKSVVFSELIPMWMMLSPQECGEWLVSNQDQAFVEDGLLRAIIDRGTISPYHGVKLALSLKKREWRAYTLEGIYLVWVEKRPEQAVSYLEDLAVLPEYENLVLLTFSTWGKNDFPKAYEWMANSKIKNKDELIRFVYLLHCENKPDQYLDWIFNSLEPEQRGAFLKTLMHKTFPKKERLILSKVKTLSNYKKDLCYGWIAVSLAGKKGQDYQGFLNKIRSSKEKENFKNLTYLKVANKNPVYLMSKLSVVELRELGETRSLLLKEYAKRRPEDAFKWLKSETAKNLLRELIFYSQDDAVSGMTKNLQLSAYFVDNFPSEIKQKPMIDGLLNPSFLTAKSIYDDYLSTINKMFFEIIKHQIKKKDVKAARHSMTDQSLKDLYTSKLLMHPNYVFTQESLRLFRAIEDENMSQRVVNYLAWQVKDENASKFLDFAESHDLLNYSLVSVLLKKWSDFDRVKASKWLHNHSNSSWYIAVSANYSAHLIQSSIKNFEEFTKGIDQSKRNLYINKLTIVFSETSPELLAVLSEEFNVKKYLQTSNKEK